MCQKIITASSAYNVCCNNLKMDSHIIEKNSVNEAE